jgi:hypothetical protein
MLDNLVLPSPPKRTTAVAKSLGAVKKLRSSAPTAAAGGGVVSPASARVASRLRGFHPYSADGLSPPHQLVPGAHVLAPTSADWPAGRELSSALVTSPPLALRDRDPNRRAAGGVNDSCGVSPVVRPSDTSCGTLTASSNIAAASPVVLSSMPRLAMVLPSPESIFKEGGFVFEHRGGNASHTQARAMIDAAAVISEAAATTPRRNLYDVYGAGTSPAIGCAASGDSPALQKQKLLRAMVTGPLFDLGAVSPVATPARTADPPSRTPGSVVLFDGVPAVVGDSAKLRHTPRPPATPKCVSLGRASPVTMPRLLSPLA